MNITEIGYFGPTTNVREARLGALDADQLAAAIALLPPRKPLGAAPVIPFPSTDTAQSRAANEGNAA